MGESNIVKEQLFDGSYYCEWRYTLDVGLQTQDYMKFVIPSKKLTEYRNTNRDQQNSDELKEFC